MPLAQTLFVLFKQFGLYTERLDTLLHELHTPGGGGLNQGLRANFLYVIAEVFLHNISSGVEIL